MERYGTLESPFDPEYLEEVVVRAGFVQVRRFVEVDELVDLPSTQGRFRGFGALRRRRLQPEYNVVHALQPVARTATAKRTPHGSKPAAAGGRTANSSCSTSW